MRRLTLSLLACLIALSTGLSGRAQCNFLLLGVGTCGSAEVVPDLTTNLVFYGSMGEATGNEVDAHGANEPLIETSGTIASTTGIQGNARDFERDESEYFEIADNAALSTGDIDFSVAAWVMLESQPVSGQFRIINKFNASGNQREYALLWYQSANKFEFIVSSDGTSGASVFVDTTGAAWTTGIWYFVAGGHNATTNDIWISVNAGTPDTTSHSGGVFATSTSSFMLGTDHSLTLLHDGLIDEVALWKEDIRSKLTWLYNSGAGRAYADLQP